jgi:hypothetical protein
VVAAGGWAEEPRLRDLSVVDDGDRVVIGDPQLGRVIAVPPVGGVVIRALQGGASLASAAAEAERFAGQPADVEAFIHRLGELGFLAGADEGPQLVRTAAIQQSRWLAGPAEKTVAWLFGRTAWVVYGVMFAFDITVMAARPQLMPHPRAVYLLVHAGAGPSVVLLFPFATALAAAHECGHWLAARAVGLSARFGIDHRMYFLVFETDLSQLWVLPRSRRFSPLLAGLAVDSAVLAALLTMRLGAAERWWTLPSLAAHLIAAVVFAEIAAMAWQCLLFLRTDLYAVLATAAGCHNLWRVKTLLLRRALKILTPGQTAELATATPRDLAVAAWFRWLWIAGFLAAAAWFGWFYLPVLIHLITWIGPSLAASPATARFWTTAACTTILAWRYGTPAALTAAEAIRARRGQRPRH